MCFLKYLGVNENQDSIYGINENLAIDDSGMILEIDSNYDSFSYTRFYTPIDINKDTKKEDIKKSIVDLSYVRIDGYLIDMINKTLNEKEYVLIESTLLKDKKYTFSKIPGLSMKYYTDIFPDAKLVLSLNKSVVYINKELKAVFLDTNTNKENKKLKALLKAVSAEFESFLNFDMIKTRKILNF